MRKGCFLSILSFYIVLAQTLCTHDTLADAGQFGEQHLEDGWRQSLLQHLQQLLGLPTHCDGVGQVVHAFLIVSLSQQLLPQLDLLQEELLHRLSVLQVGELCHARPVCGYLLLSPSLSQPVLEVGVTPSLFVEIDAVTDEQSAANPGRQSTGPPAHHISRFPVG